jgi:hypothetical protein
MADMPVTFRRERTKRNGSTGGEGDGNGSIDMPAKWEGTDSQTLAPQASIVAARRLRGFKTTAAPRKSGQQELVRCWPTA